MTSRRRSNRDHAKKQNQPGVADEVIEAQLEALLTPALFNQSLYYRQLGLRNRLLNLPLMMAAVLTLLWRNVAGVRELTARRVPRPARMLEREGCLWCQPIQVTSTGDGTAVFDLSR